MSNVNQKKPIYFPLPPYDNLPHKALMEYHEKQKMKKTKLEDMKTKALINGLYEKKPEPKPRGLITNILRILFS